MRLNEISKEKFKDKLKNPVFKVFINAAGDPEDHWATNGMEYGSPEKAEEAAKDLFMRWTAVNKWRVMDPDQENVYAEGP